MLRTLSPLCLCLALACAAAPPAPTPPDAKSCGNVCAELAKKAADEAAAAAEAAKNKAPTAADAKAFVAQANSELMRLQVRAGVAEWIKSTYITDDTERIAAELEDEALALQTKFVKEAAKFNGVQGIDADTARMLLILRLNGAGPEDPAHRLELTTIGAKLEGMYGKGKWCGADGKAKCRDLEELSKTMAKSRNYDELLDAWSGWRTISREMKPLYARSIELQNEGARSIGFADTGALWRSGYDMTPEAFEKDLDRVWAQMKPLYEDLHCYVRAKLQKKYGKDKVPDHAPPPAHLLGNMWAQEWTNVWDLVEPYPGTAKLEVTKKMEQQKWDAKRIAKTGEAFYTSLGLDPLPATFWERSMLTKPADREVVCHASAWNVNVDNDLRVKMCMHPDEETLETIHHELGHNYYEHYYYKLPWLFHGGANDGFHEAIGDSLVLSMTPAYLKQLGLVDKLPADDHGLINVQMKDAITRVAFLPFSKLIDQWRWDVFSGKTKPENYNARWWELRKSLQGVAPPVTRTETDFDPGAKYHVPANVPYTRYFLARIYQYQFHKAMCQAAGFKGPLHECNVYGSKEAGAKLKAMLELGASKPWQEAMFAMTGSRAIDAGPMLEYFKPLQDW
ncbi:MAG: M2 family metallopeptidase, partial [Deltaproteobacteria bacterium]|nr:M2 family metallopeptidase [Deltaproteobacteria bacterium]